MAWWHFILPMSFIVNQTELGQSYDCPNVSQVILKNMNNKSMQSANYQNINEVKHTNTVSTL